MKTSAPLINAIVIRQ